MHSPPGTLAFCAPCIWQVLVNLNDAPKDGDPGELTRRCIYGTAFVNAKLAETSLLFPRPKRRLLKELNLAMLSARLGDGESATGAVPTGRMSMPSRQTPL